MDSIKTIGRRKASIARLQMASGKGKITINKKELKDYFPTIVHQDIITHPFEVVSESGKYDVNLNIVGGGVTGQAEAARLAISRALCEVNAENRPALKQEGYLTRDSRVVERKKYGKRKARRSFQFSKR